ncbi:hypothetical protein EDD85DRAFT_976055, partial [Armillaria nabsnona]
MPSDSRNESPHDPESNDEWFTATDGFNGSIHTQNPSDQTENSQGSAYHASTTGQGAVTATHLPVVAPIGDSQRYPPSPPFEEAGPTSSVWRAYSDEGWNYDTDMLQGQRGQVNILLVFAGLFSAVVSNFITTSSSDLQPNYQQMSAVLLFDQINIQRGLANGISLDDIATSGTDPTAPFTPRATVLIQNGLWSTSLTLSLITAFVAMLVDASYSHYLSPIPGQPKVRARTRHLRYKGLIKWRLGNSIGILQMLLYFSLITFMLGLYI